ncbi:MAG: sigma-54-dependent Fis family transcriptional regulator [Planctomycetes bacterium]|nr:sigma-54-dependent Fis family transcriptional regulator [Planctomycetota bacterium]
MALFHAQERRLAAAVSALAYANPFLPERIAQERAALGAEFDERHASWNVEPGGADFQPNVARICERTSRLLEAARGRLLERAEASPAELALYEDLLLFVLYHRHRLGFDDTIAGGAPQGRGITALHEAFAADAERFLAIPLLALPAREELAHLFACFFQLRRAFQNIHRFIIGASAPAVRLRAAVWQSIFTHDMRRYRRSLYGRMADYTTLVTGPSGTGKELVARAVGLSRYIPFDPRRRAFAEDFAGSFHALNLSALSPTLIESELFGHRRGAFTGAAGDHAGWLEVCPPMGTVFLDEIGELDAAIQVKLLRVSETRAFSRLGETEARRFQGKIIAATNRDLSAEMRRGRFREDFYYRLCSDIIVTPSLKERLSSEPGELGMLVLHLAGRIAGEEAPAVAREVEAWIGAHLGPGYEWPGNVRELEQCVRNVLIRREYRPSRAASREPDDPVEALVAALRAGELSAEELLRRYATLVYARTGSYEQAARDLKLDRRTVRSKVDRQLLERLRRGGGGGWNK